MFSSYKNIYIQIYECPTYECQINKFNYFIMANPFTFPFEIR